MVCRTERRHRAGASAEREARICPEPLAPRHACRRIRRARPAGAARSHLGDMDAVAPRRFRFVHGLVGAVDDGLGRLVGLPKQRDADARGTGVGKTIQVVCPTQRAQDFLCDRKTSWSHQAGGRPLPLPVATMMSNSAPSSGRRIARARRAHVYKTGCEAYNRHPAPPFIVSTPPLTAKELP